MIMALANMECSVPYGYMLLGACENNPDPRTSQTTCAYYSGTVFTLTILIGTFHDET